MTWRLFFLVLLSYSSMYLGSDISLSLITNFSLDAVALNVAEQPKSLIQAL